MDLVVRTSGCANLDVGAVLLSLRRYGFSAWYHGCRLAKLDDKDRIPPSELTRASSDLSISTVAAAKVALSGCAAFIAADNFGIAD